MGTKNTVLGKIKLNISDHHYKTNINSFKIEENDIKNFLGFSNPPLNDFGLSPYFPFLFKLNEKNRVWIGVSPNKKVLLGIIKPLDIYGKFFNFHADYIRIKSNGNYFEIHFLAEKILSHLKKSFLNISNQKIYLTIENYMLGELIPDTYHREPSFVLNPKIKTSFLMMGPQHLVQEKQLPSKFPLYIHYIMEDGRVLKSLIPEWSCRKEKHKYQLNLPDFKPLRLVSQ